MTTSPYPLHSKERDRWILAHRVDTEKIERDKLDPRRPYGLTIEDERSESGEVVPTVTVFLTNRECPWRCLMCDLWRNTLAETVPTGAIAAQLDFALSQLPPARQIKLYNSGSFFDHRAIPPADYASIAERLGTFDRVIVESHPALIGDDCLRFRDMLPGRLEVAVGLETVHPEISPRLNKCMTLDDFAGAAANLRWSEIALRAFILVKPPFMNESEAVEWAGRSIDFAFGCGACAATLIPTRGGNGALEALSRAGDFAPPRLATFEAAVAHGIDLGARFGARVFADLWDLERFATCPDCFEERKARLHEINLRQHVPAPIACSSCGETRAQVG